MITVEEALQILAEHPVKPQIEELPFEKALGRVLAKPIYADRDFPPYNRVAMDGIALAYDTFALGQTRFKVERTVAAGEPIYQLSDPTVCVEIMTGALLPKGCDTVIPYEEIEISGSLAMIKNKVTARQNVHVQGADRKAGDLIVPEGIRIASPEIGLAATVGLTKLQVYRLPEICLISTGDELVPVDQIPEPHQIRSSNVFALIAALQEYQVVIDHRHLPDHIQMVKQSIRQWMHEFPILIFVGGSSMGKFDFLPEALREAGFTQHFYKIRQRPGKPIWFGSTANHFAFSLPGNPVSCLLCMEKYVKYWLDHSLGCARPSEFAQIDRDFRFTPDLTYFLQVRLSNDQRALQATPIVGGGSGDHANLADADAFIELPVGQSEFLKGTYFPLLRFRR